MSGAPASPPAVGAAFGAVLADHAARAASDPAVTCDGTTLSWVELLTRVRRTAALLADRGVQSGAVVTVTLPNSVMFVEACFALWWLGATAQPISPQLAPDERAAILELAEPTHVLGSPSAAGEPWTSVSREELGAAAASGSETSLAPVISAVWKINTSGGSTGRPKLIVAPSPAYAESVAALGERLQLPVDGCVQVTGPLTHSAPFAIAIASLLRGNHLVLMPRFDPLDCLALVERHGASWLYVVPTMMQRIWRAGDEERLRFDVSSLEVVFHMAGPCAPWLKRAWIDWLGPDTILELYGGTELQAMTFITGQEWLDHPGSVGRPVLGEIDCRDPDGAPVAPGTVGELWMRRGPGEPPPYRYIGATARAAEDGWESLGDFGYLDEEGFVYLTGRDTDMIVVGGSNVYPAEIEAALDQHPAVLTSCVIGLPDDDLGSAPHAIVQAAAPVTDDELLAFLRERIAGYKLPRSFERVGAPLRDEAGKVRRAALRDARLGS